MLCFVCEDYLGKTFRVQSHLCDCWEVKPARPAGDAGPGRPGQAGRKGIVRDAGAWGRCLVLLPRSPRRGCWGLLAGELLMWRASISFLRGPAACRTGWLTDWLTDRRTGAGRQAGKKINIQQGLVCFFLFPFSFYFVSIHFYFIKSNFVTGFVHHYPLDPSGLQRISRVLVTETHQLLSSRTRRDGPEVSMHHHRVEGWI